MLDEPLGRRPCERCRDALAEGAGIDRDVGKLGDARPVVDHRPLQRGHRPAVVQGDQAPGAVGCCPQLGA
jgi:hypothetical protein